MKVTCLRNLRGFSSVSKAILVAATVIVLVGGVWRKVPYEVGNDDDSEDGATENSGSVSRTESQSQYPRRGNTRQCKQKKES